MTDRFAATPFGGGRFSAAIFRRQDRVEKRRGEIASADRGGNDTGRVEKWPLLRALTEARATFELSDRTIAVLEALLSFHQDKELDGGQPIVVFPSNAELSLRTRGMAPATLRRHIAALVEAELIFRRDSPNGKRYCRRDDHGEIESAFGFDLAPLALAATAIFEAADLARTEARAVQRLRGELTVHLRDITKVIDAARHEGHAGDWEGFAERLHRFFAQRLPRNATSVFLEMRRDELIRLRAEVEAAYLASLSEQEMSANDSVSERQIQNSNTDHFFESSNEDKKKPADARKREIGKEPDIGQTNRESGGAMPLGGDQAAQTNQRAPETKSVPVPLGYLHAVCPALADYAKDGLQNWRDVVVTAGLVRSMLGISLDAWEKARSAMGDLAAAAVVAAILERADAIRSPGGYLRSLTERAEAGKFSVLPMLAALEDKGQSVRSG